MEHSIRSITKGEYRYIEGLYKENEYALDIYASLLQWWNTKINLISRDVSRETIISHIQHSLFISILKSFKQGESFFDTGAGGGLPGIPLSICFPQKNFIINDIVTKKVFAVNDIINRLELKKRTQGLASNVKDAELNKEVILLSKHAFKVDDLFNLVKEKQWKRIVFLKGAEEALEEAKRINEKARIEIVKLETDFTPAFYKGKAVVDLERIIDE